MAVGRLLARRFRRNRLSLIGLAILLVWIVVGLLAPALAPFDPVEVRLDARMVPPASGHWLGTDFYGRDILSRIIYGARYDLLIALFAVGVASGVGAPLGIVAGYLGGRLDDVIMRGMDIIIAFPGLVLAMALASVLGPGLEKAILALAVVGVAGYARIARASTLSVREEVYVEAARALGASDLKILARHVFPNVISPVVVRATLGMGFTVLLAASLSFIGLGAQPPTPEWGAMINEGRNQLITGRWWVSTFPGLAIMSLVLGFNLLGDGIRDVLDPRGIVRM
ncbi:MAG: ABC transporter permease [Armatimonadota bacterium]|nr:ABC transporter permease [Armatimonadota bacterium]MDR7545007.1 ABC transporter permease [Armatimonadota bacterium]